MLPEHHYIDDAQWIAEQLSMLPVAYIQRAATEYSRVYGEHWDSEPSEIRKEHAARHNANTRLRLFVQRIKAHIEGL